MKSKRDPILPFATCRKQDHGSQRPSPEMLQNVKAIQPWEHHIQQDQIVFTFQRLCQSSTAVVRDFEAKIIVGKKLRHHSA